MSRPSVSSHLSSRIAAAAAVAVAAAVDRLGLTPRVTGFRAFGTQTDRRSAIIVRQRNSAPLALATLVAACLFALAGCDATIDEFKTNDVYALSLASSRSVPTDAAKRDTSELLTTWFGTPNDPRWPIGQMSSPDVGDVVSPERLFRAAGGVKSIQSGEHVGLYREHCVVCHGLEGSGAGPASIYQNPYPRDFRAGVFKWKSTMRAAPPTRDDLRHTLTWGIPGTAMPSFAGLDSEELESLIDYVIYLSIRGQLERELLDAAIDEFGYETAAPDDAQLRYATFDVNDQHTDSEAVQLAAGVLQELCKSWSQADEHVIVVPSSIVTTLIGEELSAAIQRGRDLFHGQVANCVGCHGPAGGGGVATLDYDDWTKAYSTRLGLTPSNAEAMRPMREVGALPPRTADPRNLQLGVFRGGGSPATLYRRITQGIAGTPMPAVEITSEPTAKSLSVDQVGDLIHYVRSLGAVTAMTADHQTVIAISETQP